MKENICATIESTRQKLIESIRKYGMSNQNTISLSEQLDKLIYNYQKNHA